MSETTNIYTAKNLLELEEGPEEEQPGQDRKPQGMAPITEEVIPNKQRRSSRWALLLVLLGLSLLTAGGLWYHLRGDQTRDRRRAPASALAQLKPAQRASDLGRSSLSAGQPGSPRATDGGPEMQTSTAPIPTDPRPEPPAPAGIHASGPRRGATPRKLSRSAAGEISIVAPQPGEVFLDGKRLGPLPVGNRFDSAPGNTACWSAVDTTATR